MDAQDSDGGATLTVGPTSTGMVRILVEDDGTEMPMDFDPDQADEIAEELRAAAQRARTAPPAPSAPSAASAASVARPGAGRRR